MIKTMDASKLFNSIHHIAIICSDYEKSKHFYTSILGMKVIAENVAQMFKVENGSLTFSRANVDVLNHIFEATTNLRFGGNNLGMMLTYRYNDFSEEYTPIFYPKHLFSVRPNYNQLFNFINPSFINIIIINLRHHFNFNFLCRYIFCSIPEILFFIHV